MPKEAIIFCLKCNLGIEGQLPCVLGSQKVIDGELANRIKSHHVETSVEGKNHRHRDFLVLQNDGEGLGSIFGSSYEVVYREYNRDNLGEIRHDQVLNGYDITDYIEMVRRKTGK